ncbi:Crotonobetainyl-CoA:carnitine CoA-transferase CaiB [Cyclonatronum proteinivorum]|uniref:Crotonobetainyl-CoA:carnitine CoA-transferase CaiB n=1 Tax=Cyclonatronum proteinivorum TaxID=1457365 RepID=A0A345UMW0_9BACT|nr:CoA transferase [Cyclonatronum proteinivorum]AXJ01812.1 Crotonobetainyl-CoA:carnitine CoA-transferase CaiB [Cyclonatronum proteinivorum]
MILEGVRVVELASVLAGPSVGMFLAELGAEVLKIENPHTKGDVTRSWQLRDEKPENGCTSYFNAINWGKCSLVLDARNEHDRTVLLKHIRAADIVITSFKPGDAEKLGLSWETLQAENPALIYAAITGYGDEDARTAYDALLQAESGFMYLNREPGREPLKMPVALMDVLAAHHLKQLILIAWIQRLKTGKGCRVDVSLFESAVSSLVNQAGSWQYAGISPEPMGSEHPHIYPYGESFCCGDGRSIVLAVGNDTQFRSLCGLLGCPELSEDEKFATNAARSRNRNALRLMLGARFAQSPDAEKLIQEFHQAKVPAALIRNIPEALKAYAANPAYARHISPCGSMEGLPQLSGRINGKRATRNLDRPPAYPQEKQSPE